jgi:hypothetical protein
MSTCGHCGFETLANPCYRCGTSRVEVTYSVADGAARRELESRKRITRALAMLDGLRQSGEFSADHNAGIDAVRAVLSGGDGAGPTHEVSADHGKTWQPYRSGDPLPAGTYHFRPWESPEQRAERARVVREIVEGGGAGTEGGR